ncbi:hypothetical protein HJC23_001114 [Cyclotella cryptica]|uniref:Uncharacterized protein n=1 Tax=Cyclotella cryptica TaxID=29204 RepID=A0ABD3QID5_9STRA|eukprot:CCRYP_005089-RA/>CCRYP_005089-RA protein AED:0.37 eAED:0.34 QI:0/-1/0/1/-1/1/1/0/977
MTKKKVNTDWEQQLASIIEKSNQNLTELTSEYNRVKATRPASYEWTVSHLPARAFEPMPTKELLGVDKKIAGPHERAALDAFKTTITRPVSRSSEDDIMRRIETRTSHCIEKALDEKLTSVSRAIDALRDQICVMADEVRELHHHASRTTKSLSSHERRMDVICHDVDTKRHSIEAHLADEISGIKHLFAQSFERGMSTTISPFELKSAIETSELNTKMLLSKALAPLRNSFRAELSSVLNEFGLVKDSLEGLVDEKLAVIEKKVLKSQTRLVKIENEAITKKCLGVLESNVDRLAEMLRRDSDERATSQRKETMNIIADRVGFSVADIERNLTDQLTTKLEEKAKELQDQPALKPNTHTLTKEGIETLHQSFANMNNGLSNVKEKLEDLEKRISSAESSRKKNDSDISSLVESLSWHKTMVQKLVTRDELEKIREQMTERTDQVSSNKCELESVLSESAREWSSKFSSLEEVLYAVQSSNDSTPDLTYLEARVEDIEAADFNGKLNKILDVVESFEQRVQAIENSGASEHSHSKSQDSTNINKVELGKLVKDFEDRSNAAIKYLSARIHAIEMQEPRTPFPNFSYHEGDAVRDGAIRPCTQTEDCCDSLSEAIKSLNCTLSEAKELGCSKDKAKSNESVLSNIESQKQAKIAQKDGDHTHVKLPTPNPTKPEDMKSPCVHLMGLISPGSHGTFSISLPRQSLAEKELDTNYLATDKFEGPVEISKYFNDLEEETKTLRLEASLTAIGFNETQDALSSCGVLTDDSMEGGVIDETNSPMRDSIFLAASNRPPDELAGTRDHNSLSPESNLPFEDIPMNDCSHVLKEGGNPEPISFFLANQSNDNAVQPMVYLQNDADDSSSISSSSIAQGKPTPAQDDVLSIPGSLTSFDDFECLSNSVPFSKTTSSVSYYPTQHTNFIRDEGWISLLTELRASGRILKDSDDGDLTTAPEENRIVMENGIEHEYSVSYDSSFESEC